DVTRGYGAGATSQRGDGLGTADREQRVGAGDRSRGPDQRLSPRRSDPDFANTRNPSGNNGHQHARPQRITSARRIAARALDGKDLMARATSGDLRLERAENLELCFGEGPDPSGRSLEKLPLLARESTFGVVKLAAFDDQRGPRFEIAEPLPMRTQRA